MAFLLSHRSEALQYCLHHIKGASGMEAPFGMDLNFEIRFYFALASSTAFMKLLMLMVQPDFRSSFSA